MSQLGGHSKKYIDFLSGRGIIDGICSSVLHDLAGTVFNDIQSHMFDSDINDNHIYQLIKRISKKYSRMRMFHLGKEFKTRHLGKNIRNTLSRLIVNKHQ